MISFKISIFALSNTTGNCLRRKYLRLWLALKLVSLHYQIQHIPITYPWHGVVISFKISIFALSNTTYMYTSSLQERLWLALKLVSLHYQIQQFPSKRGESNVVISFKISIFALSNTTSRGDGLRNVSLWLALKLVSLHYQIQHVKIFSTASICCD